MKIAVVVQRYGDDINGGAERHARYLAERLAERFDVRVLTTCARDHVTWRNELPPGVDEVRGIHVERFQVSRERNLADLGTKSRRVFLREHTIQEELEWLEAEGPVCPGLLRRLKGSGNEFDWVLLFCARYYQTFHGVRAVANRAVLVPTAERDPALGVRIFQSMFRGVRAIMYNSFEERRAIQAVSRNEEVPSVVVGVGSDIPSDVSADRARRKFDQWRPFLVYVGRIDANKGCADLFELFLAYANESPRDLDLLLIGSGPLAVPEHPRIRHLGFLTDSDKFDILSAATALVMPSYYESLSMVALEAWALGRPVIANAKCDVLRGQCMRSNAGLYYEQASDFAAVVDRLVDDTTLSAALGRNGREFFRREYGWPVIEGKYLDMFDRLASRPTQLPLEPLPGWFGRRQPTAPAAVDVVAGLPSGPVIDPVQIATVVS
jgi:glycosyltransferase involved in cell wall biosynthesis